MERWFRLLLVGLVLAAGAAGCKKDATLGTVPAPKGPLEHTKEPVKLIPLPP
jgi:hypothetical protein